MKKKEFEKYFYNYYFKSISERESIPIESFYHPKNSSSIKIAKFQNAPKTINNFYIQNISKSQEFVD